MQKSYKGFTLAELLVAMVIISIFAVMALPFSLNLYQGHQLNYSTNALLSTFIQASESAKLNNHVITINLNKEGRDDDHTRYYTIPNSIVLSTTQDVPLTLYMNPNGYIQKSLEDSTPMQEFKIQLCHDNNNEQTSRTVSIQTKLITSDGVVKNNCNFT